MTKKELQQTQGNDTLPQPAPAFSNDHQLTGGQAAGSDGEEDSAASSSKPDSQKVSPRPRQPGYCKDL